MIEKFRDQSIGRSGSLELSADIWKSLGPAGRNQAAQIMEDEKLLVQPSFRAPMLAKIPFPPWALRKEEALLSDEFKAPSSVEGPIARPTLTAQEI